MKINVNTEMSECANEGESNKGQEKMKESTEKERQKE